MTVYIIRNYNKESRSWIGSQGRKQSGTGLPVVVMSRHQTAGIFHPAGGSLSKENSWQPANNLCINCQMCHS